MNRSVLLALALAGLLVTWMLTGNNTQISDNQKPALKKQMQVVVTPSKAQLIAQTLTANGQALPSIETTLKAEMIVVVDKIHVKEGASVKKGDLLISFKLSDRLARLNEATAKVEDEQMTLDAMTQLHPQGFSAKTTYFETKAELAKAKARLLAIQIEISKTKVIAPFDGIVSELNIEEGDYLKAGEKVGYMISNSPILVKVGIAQKNISQLHINDKAHIILATGHTLNGHVQFIAPVAEQNSRMFNVEIVADNPQKLRSGVSAKVSIDTSKIKAHFISPALLSLNMQGKMGIKILSKNSTVQFIPIKIAKAEANGLWISDLPDQLTIITVGQGFVEEGESVTVIPARAGDNNEQNH